MRPEIATVRYDGETSSLSERMGLEGVRIETPNFANHVQIDHLSVKFPSFLYACNLEKRLGGGDLPAALPYRIEALAFPDNADFVRAADAALRGELEFVNTLAEANCIDRLPMLPSYLLAFFAELWIPLGQRAFLIPHRI
ncbi:MAG: hypothetical protein AAGI88_15065 [Pseudomonadota bacterium]